MALRTAAVAAWAFMAAGAGAADSQPTTSDTIGPAAFMWPPDRVWSADADNTAPCGSIADNGRIALVAQDESFDLELSISYLDDPRSNSDFTQLIDMETFRDIKLGHTCVTLPRPASSVHAGTNATLQIKYIADFDKPENQTFYACSDITYVELSDFKERIPCFNATQESPPGTYLPGAPKSGSGSSSGGSAASATPSPSSSSTSSTSGTSGNGGKKTGLSGGAIAGIVIGSLAGVGLLAAAALLIFRRRKQRLRLLRQQNSERGKWAAGGGRDSQSQGSVRMNNL
ncbi:GPI anchored protein [Cordyceps javanica]|uniref:GPI anchored protein n=1 Tax=Cordyceps javanica TaxID=43265 RepID=A0A545UZH4_9HYPO|nr:GPI anchored protein [Cordyceps javanica]TQW06738.1 GPI anchored protein [Cordyceps javanica]